MESAIQSEINEIEPSALIVLYEMVLKDYNKSYYFHAGENGFENEIKFQENNYYYVPIKADGFDTTDSSLPRPTITIDNNDSFFSLKTRFFKNFIGFTLKRTRTFVKFLHGDNFPNNINPFGTPTEISFPVERYIVNKKIAENQNVIQLELASPLEKENALLPNRKIVYNTCQWRYRSSVGCGYSGEPISDGNGNDIGFAGGSIGIYKKDTTYNSGEAVKIIAPPNSDEVDKVFVCKQNDTIDKNPLTQKDFWVMDVCPKNISGCRARFGNNEKNNGLPFGGFPGSWEY